MARRPPGKAMLAAVAALLALAGGVAAAAIVAEDDPAGEPTSAASAPGATREQTIGEPNPPGQTTEPETPPEPQRTEGSDKGGGETTEFQGERDKRKQADAVRRRFPIPPARTFSGTGNARLGNIDIHRTSMVRWSTQGRFELRFGRESFPIAAPSPTGQLVVPAYNFKLVRVIASGRWTISITPQK